MSGPGGVRPFLVGDRWDEGKQLLKSFDGAGVTVLRLYPEPFAARKSYQEPVWKRVRPAHVDLRDAEFADPDPRAGRNGLERVALGGEEELRLLLQGRRPLRSLEWESRHARKQCAEKVPKPLRDAIVERYGDRQFHMVNFVCRCPGGFDLILSNPALAYCWASAWCFRRVQRPLRSARAYLRRKQREQLRVLGFPGSESVRRVLARVATASFTVPRYLWLRQACWSEEAMRRLRWLPEITGAAVHALTDPALSPHVGHRFLLELGRSEDPGIFRRMRDTLEMAHRAGRLRGLVFGSEGHLTRVHEELIGALNRAPRRDRPDLVLPPAPLPGCSVSGFIGIEPLQTAAAVAEWGKSQRNCIEHCYLDPVAEGAGGRYLYRVLFPEAATLLIVRGVGGRFRIDELRGEGNRPVAAATREAVQRWMDDVQGGR